MCPGEGGAWAGKEGPKGELFREARNVTLSLS